MSRKKIAVLGATGSIGRNAINVIEKYSGELEAVALTAHSNISLLSEQARRVSPSFVAVTGECDERKAGELFGDGIDVGFGKEAVIEACDMADMVVLGIVGMAALPAFEHCLKNDIPVALANKEAMVCGGRLVRDIMDERKSCVLPVDSETFAIWQCLYGHDMSDVRSVLLTASGGPFRTRTFDETVSAKPEDALRHPNWSMGAKITVDCATMLNKGLEVMETRWLFDIPPDDIRVVVHPESIIHSMVEYNDNAVMAQLAVPDMRLPIAGALLYPKMARGAVDRLDLFGVASLHFEAPSTEKFPCLGLAYEAVRNEGITPVVLNSANEIAVARFLGGDFLFGGIPKLIEAAMRRFGTGRLRDFEDIYRLDGEVREYCSGISI